MKKIEIVMAILMLAVSVFCVWYPEYNVVSSSQRFELHVYSAIAFVSSVFTMILYRM